MGGFFICARSRIATYDKKYYTEKKQTEGVDMYIADLHIHSRFSRATSRDGDAPHLDWWARRKGIAVLGTGDFTHPAWRAELKEQLVAGGSAPAGHCAGPGPPVCHYGGDQLHLQARR